ncbi:hypothetical protein LZ31DRAFT_636886 [Colletotrichum somersetense]|nr:hypothetical protein LZ31DRAFT_636886 [Colletotrichum somersetense]
MTWQVTTFPSKVSGNMPGEEAGGRIAVDLESTKIIFIGTQSGNGLCKSTDVESESDASNSNVQGLTIVTFDKPSDAASGVSSKIFVGTAGNTTAPIYVSTVADAT